MNNVEIVITIFLIFLVTYSIRMLPFLMVKNRQLPLASLKTIDLLPSATISLLVIYSLKDTNSTNAFATIIALVTLVVIHKWKKNSILTIITSTAVYMLLVK